MNIFVANLLICCFWLIIYSGLSKRDNARFGTISLLLIAISFVQIVFVHAAVDVNSVPDLPSYQSSYSYKGLSWSELIDNFRTNEIAFYLSYQLCQLFSDNFSFYLLIYSIFIITVYYLTFYKYSYNILLSVVLVLLLPYAQSVFVLRQHLALAICLLTVPLIFEKKMILFLIICFIAFFTHHSAIVWVPIYFLYNVRSRFSIIATGLLLIGAFVFASNNLLMINDVLQFDYSMYLIEGNTSITKMAVSVAYLLSYIYFCRKHIFDEGIHRLTTIALFICTLGYVLNIGISLLSRLLLYYEVFLTISIPLTVKYIQNNIFKVCFTFCVLLLQGIVSLSQFESEIFRDFQLDSMPFHYFIIIALFAILIVKWIKRNGTTIVNQ